jgi:hypothetical protein
MQSTTRWCLNEGSMLNRMYDQNGVFHKAHKPPFVPNRPNKFTGQCLLVFAPSLTAVQEESEA